MGSSVYTDGQTFGEFFKQKRLELGMTLRMFCREYDLDPGNISKLERGRLRAPQSKDKLREYATYLRLNSAEWEIFSDLAAISAGRIPEDLTEAEVAKRLPLFFRAARNKDITDEALKELVELIRRS